MLPGVDQGTDNTKRDISYVNKLMDDKRGRADFDDRGDDRRDD